MASSPPSAAKPTTLCGALSVGRSSRQIQAVPGDSAIGSGHPWGRFLVTPWGFQCIVLEQVYVDPDWARQGVGTLIVDALVQVVRAAGGRVELTQRIFPATSPLRCLRRPGESCGTGGARKKQR